MSLHNLLSLLFNHLLSEKTTKKKNHPFPKTAVFINKIALLQCAHQEKGAGS